MLTSVQWSVGDTLVDVSHACVRWHVIEQLTLRQCRLELVELTQGWDRTLHATLSVQRADLHSYHRCRLIRRTHSSSIVVRLTCVRLVHHGGEWRHQTADEDGGEDARENFSHSQQETHNIKHHYYAIGLLVGGATIILNIIITILFVHNHGTTNRKWT